MKRALVIVLFILAGALIGHMHAAMQGYHPVVKLTTPDGLVFTGLLGQASGRLACGEANKRFLEPLKKQCPECKVMAARCERELQGLELALEREEPLPHHVLVVPGQIRMAIAGPEEAAKLNCGVIAEDVSKKARRRAFCMPPAASAGR